MTESTEFTNFRDEPKCFTDPSLRIESFFWVLEDEQGKQDCLFPDFHMPL